MGLHCKWNKSSYDFHKQIFRKPDLSGSWCLFVFHQPPWALSNNFFTIQNKQYFKCINSMPPEALVVTQAAGCRILLKIDWIAMTETVVVLAF